MHKRLRLECCISVGFEFPKVMANCRGDFATLVLRLRLVPKDQVFAQGQEISPPSLPPTVHLSFLTESNRDMDIILRGIVKGNADS
jgi:hypothetical protein